MIEKLDFLTSRRFWCLVVAVLIGGFRTIGYIPVEVADPIIKFLLGFITIATVDKFSKAIALTKTNG